MLCCRSDLPSVSLLSSDGAGKQTLNSLYIVSSWSEETANLGFPWRCVRVAMEETCFFKKDPEMRPVVSRQGARGGRDGVDTSSEGGKQSHPP